MANAHMCTCLFSDLEQFPDHEPFVVRCRHGASVDLNQARAKLGLPPLVGRQLLRWSELREAFRSTNGT